MRLPARAESLRTTRALLTDYLSGLGCADDCLDDAKLAANEAVSNVIRHAYCDRPEPGDFELELKPNETDVELVVRDRGRGFSPNPTSDGAGLGLPLMKALSRTLEINAEPGEGTELRARFPLR